MFYSFNSFRLKLIIVSFLLFNSSTVLTQTKFGGLALYTVRDAMKDDVRGTLQKVVEAGYSYVETADYANGKFYNMSPEAFKSILDEVGLIPLSSHIGSVTYDNADRVIQDLKAVGFKYLVIPVPPMGLYTSKSIQRNMNVEGESEKMVLFLNTIGEKCKKAGLNLLYHNHDFEFQPGSNGEIVYDFLIENTSKEYVNFQMDLFWVTKAGADPVQYFEKYPDRFKIWHVKDMDDQGRFTPIGNGHINLKRILAQKEQSGMEYYMVEQDKTFNMSPFEAIIISHVGLENLGFQ